MPKPGMKSQNKTLMHWRRPQTDTQLKDGTASPWRWPLTPHFHSKSTLTRSARVNREPRSFCKWTICQEAVYIPSPAPLFNTLALKGKSFLISYGLSYFNQLTSGVQLWQPWQAKTGDVPTADFPSRWKKKTDNEREETTEFAISSSLAR